MPCAGRPLSASANISCRKHWQNGHLAPNIQKRGHIFAQRGYVVLSPDALGAGDLARAQELVPGNVRYIEPHSI